MYVVQVEWEFWTNSNDMCGAVCDVQREFIKVGRVLPSKFVGVYILASSPWSISLVHAKCHTHCAQVEADCGRWHLTEG